MAEAAERLLKQQGAAVKLEAYEEVPSGGQTGENLSQTLRRGIHWLEEGK
jgi:hypothetical protein